MTARKRGDSGEFESDITTADVLDAVDQHAPAGTREVADELGMTRQGATYRLRQLAEAGAVSSKKVGGTLVWSVADEA